MLAFYPLLIHTLPFFFFNDPAPTETYPLPPHAALPICAPRPPKAKVHSESSGEGGCQMLIGPAKTPSADRKSTRLNSSHQIISYAVFCLKKKKRLGPFLEKGAPSTPVPAATVASVKAAP